MQNNEFKITINKLTNMAYKTITRRNKKLKTMQKKASHKHVTRHKREFKGIKGGVKIEFLCKNQNMNHNIQKTCIENEKVRKFASKSILLKNENKKRKYSQIDIVPNIDEHKKRFKANQVMPSYAQKRFKDNNVSNGFVKIGISDKNIDSYFFDAKINFLYNNCNLIMDTKEMYKKNIEKYGKENVYVLPSNANVFDYFNYYQSPEYRANPKQCIFSEEDVTPREPTLSQMLFDMDEHCNEVHRQEPAVESISDDVNMFSTSNIPSNDYIYIIDDLERSLNNLKCRGLTENTIECIAAHIEKLNFVSLYKLSHLNKTLEHNIENQTNATIDNKKIEIEDNSNFDLEELFNDYHEDDMMLFQ